MKKYFFEAERHQSEKPTEKHHIFTAAARITVYADTLQQAEALAREQLLRAYFGTGILLGAMHCTGTAEPAVDWSYGYADNRRPGTPEAMEDLIAQSVIR